MNKKIVIVLVLVVTGAAIFLFFRNTKKDETNKLIGQEAFTKLTDISKKVPQAGLTQMGFAIKQYQEKKGSYPEKLADLYPDYIPNKGFIDEINWHYESKGNDFLLSKTIAKGSEQIVASVDKALIPKLSGEMMVAAAPKKEAPPKPEIKLPELPEIKPLLPPAPTAAEAAPDEQIVDTLIEQLEILAVEDGQIKEGMPEDIGKTVLVWKDEKGTLGFGNIVYPETRQLSIYKNNKWIKIKRPAPKVPEEVTSAGVVVPGQASDEAGNYWIWQDDKGQRGYGNMELPGGKNIKIFNNKEWIDLKEIQSELPSITQVSGPAEPKRLPAEIAAEYSNRYFVWKDKKGNLGYGNIQYPGEHEIDSICVDGNWQKPVN